MTIKMLIVDDEPIICEGLRTTIPWVEFGVEVAGVAFDGVQALAIIQAQEIDIVLTDVMMPEMDGIELIKILYEKKYPVQTIVISGYNEFDYAREALRYGVKDYLLKPVDIDELTTIVQNLKGSIIEKKRKNEEQHIEKVKQWLSHHLLKTPIFHEIDQKEWFPSSAFCFIVSEINNMAPLMEKCNTGELNEIKLRWERLIQDHLMSKGFRAVSVFTHPNVLTTLCYGNKISIKEVRGALEKINPSWDLELTFGISEVFGNLDSIMDRYEQTKQLLSFKEWAGTSILDNNIPFESQTIEKWVESEIIDQLTQSFLRQNEEELMDTINSLFNEFRVKQYSLHAINETVQGILLSVEQRMSEILAEGQFQHATMDVHIYNTSRSIQTKIIQNLKRYLEEIKTESIGKNYWLVEKGRAYIQENYQRDLKASEVANEIHISPNYFSMIFKREFGKSFNEYLNELRIEKAKTLLVETSDRVFEIAKEVGYKEYKYFVMVFRKVTGMTPTAFRELKIK